MAVSASYATPIGEDVGHHVSGRNYRRLRATGQKPFNDPVVTDLSARNDHPTIAPGDDG